MVVVESTYWQWPIVTPWARCLTCSACLLIGMTSCPGFLGITWCGALQQSTPAALRGQYDSARCSVNARCLNKGTTDASVNLSVLGGPCWCSARSGRGWSKDCSPGFRPSLALGKQQSTNRPKARLCQVYILVRKPTISKRTM